MKTPFHALALGVAAALSAGSTFSATPAAGADRLQSAVDDVMLDVAADPSVQRALAVAPEDQFVARSVQVDTDGTEHVRLDRWHRGLPVIGGDTVVHQRVGQVVAASKTLAAPLKVAAEPRIDERRAIALALRRFDGEVTMLPKATLSVYARGDTPVLAWDVYFEGIDADQTPTETHAIIDAMRGREIDRWDLVHTASANGTGQSLYLGTVNLATDSITSGFALRDPTRGNNSTGNAKASNATFTDADNRWGTGSNSNAQSAAVDAHFGVSRTWDYFKTVHGRNGIANDGRGSSSRVHYGTNYVNAFWSNSCFCMTYGDGDGTTYGPLVNLDVAGHEMTHGVTSRTANLTYSGESGGLNEATSDIFGTMVEYYANVAADTPDYQIGEKIYLSNPGGSKAFRFMFKPSLDGKSPDCYTSTLGQLNVHYSSGVGNHFFYLLAEGATVPAGFNLTKAALVCNGNTAITGIGRDKASRIWYRALTTYMTSNTNYRGARTATLNAARDLYGSGSAEQNAVAAAWSAVSVN